MWKKLCAVLLALMLVAGSAMASSYFVRDPEEPGACDKDFGGITLKVWQPLMWTSVVGSLDENEAYKVIADKFNVKFEFITPVVGSEQEQFNLLMAGDELPDIIFTGWAGTDMYVGGLDKYVEDGVIINLLDHKELMPNYLYCIDKYVTPEEKKEFYTDGGNMTQFAAISPYEEYSCNGLLFRQDWLQELGLELPTTLDEMENVLQQFKDVKGATAPFHIPSNGLDESAGFIVSAWDIGPTFYQNDEGKVQYGPCQPEFKEYLKKMNDWYEKGLINADFVSTDQEQYRSMLINGKIGVTIDSPDNTYTYMHDVANLIGGNYPMLEKDQKCHFRAKLYQFRPPYCAAITADCKNVEAAYAVLDYGYCYDGFMLLNFGIEGLCYNMVDDVPVYTDVMLNNPDYPSLLDSFAKYKMHIGPFLRFEHEGDAAITQENMGTRRMLTENADTAHCLPMISMTSDEGSEYASIMTQVNTYKNAAIDGFIMGTKDIDAEFDKFVDDLKAMKIDRAVEIQQAALERYNAR